MLEIDIKVQLIFKAQGQPCLPAMLCYDRVWRSSLWADCQEHIHHPQDAAGLSIDFLT